MVLDPISEQIAHFIGHFSIKLEAARQRDQYDLFKALRKKTQSPEDIESIKHTVSGPYELQDLTPGVKHEPGAEQIVLVRPDSWYPQPYFSVFAEHWFPDGRPFWLPHPTGHAISPSFRSPEIIYYPGSIAILTRQTNLLQDNDFVGSPGDFGAFESQLVAASQALDGLVELAANHDRIPVLSMPGSEEDIAITIRDLVDEVSSWENVQTNDGPDHVFLGHGGGVITVNAVESGEAPALDDYQHTHDADDDLEAADHDASTDLSEIAAGGNIVVNEAVIVSSWTVSPVYAVVEDFISLDLISQVNVWSDHDDLESLLTGATDGQSAHTAAFNVASVFRTAADGAGTESSASNSSIFPSSWSVTHVKGNLILLNWTEQINVVEDNDWVNVATSAGKSVIVVGENLIVNSKFVQEFGFNYDLIIIGGSMLSANVIEQLNILLDDDTIDGGFAASGTGEGGLSTGDNLLWNEANIVHVGDLTFEDLPEHYLEAALRLADGNDAESAAILKDPAFSGLRHLKVLYIEGDLLSLNYIKQTNVVSDADRLLIADGNLSDISKPPAVISAGQNDLLNLAKIVDISADATIKVGGEIYSDSLLHQAGLVDGTGPHVTSDTVPIITEAVVFLADDMLGEDNGSDADNVHGPIAETVSVDVMQTMLG